MRYITSNHSSFKISSNHALNFKIWMKSKESLGKGKEVYE